MLKCWELWLWIILKFLFSLTWVSYTIFIISAIRENMLILQIPTAHPDSAKRLLPACEHAQRCSCNEQQRQNTFNAQLVLSKSWLYVKCYVKSWIVMELLNLLISFPLSRTLHPQFFPIRRTTWIIITWTLTSNPWKPIPKCIVRPQKETNPESKLGQGNVKLIWTKVHIHNCCICLLVVGVLFCF